MWKIFAVLTVVAGLIVSVWFKDGYILGIAEDGLTFYNLSHYLQTANYAWMEYPGLGSPSLTLIAGKPTFFLFSLIQEAGIPGFLIQAWVMWFLLVSAGIGVYLLVKELFPKLPQKHILLSVLFYWFNPISLFDVWNRFLLNYIFFFSLLPIGTYLYLRGLRTRRYIWILALNLSLLFFSYAFSYVAFIILFWLWLVVVTFFFFLFNKEKKSRIFTIKYLLCTLLIFCIVNSWWVLPLINLYFSEASGPTTNLFIKQNNVGLLGALSKSVGSLKGIFQLVNLSFLSSDSLVWVKLYYSPVLSIIQYSIVGLIIYFLIKRRKDNIVFFLGSLFLTTIFLSKGNNPPFGEIYSLIFNKILIFQVFRNPFEKFGFLLSLTATLLIAPSIYELTRNIRDKFKRFIFPAFFVAIFFYLGFPLYTGLVLTNKFPPTNHYSIGYKVKVPDYYSEVNNFLIGQGNNFRYIGLPLKDEGITYNWEKGYAGAELTVPLFSNSGILLNTSTPFFNQVVPEIEKTLLSDKDFSVFANLLNARYYLLRYDIDYNLRGMTDPLIIEKVLKRSEKKGEVKKVAAFGKVNIWENLKWQDNTFYIARRIINKKSYSNPPDFTEIDVLKGYIFLDQDSSSKIREVLDQDLDGIVPIISYRKINTTKYLLHITNASRPFLFAFSELYNTGWQASYQDGRVLDNHFQVNVFGNGWVADRRGDYDILIEFASQRWMDFGEKVSFAGYILIAGCFFYLLKKQKSI